MAFIRPFQPSDSEATAYICRATLPPSLASSPAAALASPYVWTHQYTTLRPGNCFVLDDGAGRAVGYVIGCPDVFAFARAYPRYVEEVLKGAKGREEVPVPETLEVKVPWSIASVESDGEKRETVNPVALAQLAYNPSWLLLEGPPGKAELAAAWRATMHIDLLPDFQGKGWGRKMIETFIGSLRRDVEGSKEGEGEGEEPLDFGKGIHIGVSGENTKVVPFYERCGFRVHPGGEAEGNVWMVKDL